jgi:hypothetical protein
VGALKATIQMKRNNDGILLVKAYMKDKAVARKFVK